MATYLDQDLPVATKEFTPNYELIMRTLQLKQTQYDQGFSKVKSVYNSILNADMTGEDHKERRNQIIANAENALKNLPTVDLSLPQNVTTAKKAFQPFYEDDAMLQDIVFTKSSKTNVQNGVSLQDAEKKEDRDRYWGQGIQYIMDGIEEYKNATDDERKNMSARRYVAKPNIDDEIMKLFQDGKIKISRDYIGGKNGEVKYTDENGKELKDPIMNLYLARAQNDPEVMEAFKVMGSVNRTGFVRENAERYGGRQQAQQVYDTDLVRKYRENKQYQIGKINESLANINVIADSWEKKAKDNKLKPEEAQQAAKDIADRTRLTESLRTAQIAYDESDARIMNNPTAYVGEMFLTKSARDLAESLSQFGSRKIEVNPIYEKTILPKELKLYEHQLAVELERIKTDEAIRQANAIQSYKNEYGDSGGGSDQGGAGTTGGGGSKGSVGRNSLNIPFALETQNTASVPYTDDLGQANTYKMQQIRTNEVIGDLGYTKLSFIENVLNNNEIVDSKGRYINNSERSKLLTNGTELDRLYTLAVKKHDAYVSTNNPLKMNSLHLKEHVKNLNDVWTSSILFRKDKLSQITGELAGLKDNKDGFVYKSILKDGLVPDVETNIEKSKQEFVDRLSTSKDFDARVKEQYQKNVAEFNNNHYVRDYMLSVLQPGIGTLGALIDPITKAIKGAPTMEQAKTQLLSEYKDNFNKYVNTIVETWNKNSYDYYAPGQKGGGIYTRVISYAGTNSVQGEKADVFLQNLYEKVLMPYAGDNEAVKVTTHSDKALKSDVENNSELKDIILGRIKNDALTSIKVGKGTDMGNYNLAFSGSAGNKGQYHKYTLTFDKDYINKLVENKTHIAGSTEYEAFTAETGKAFASGIDIYVKKDKGNQSLMAKESTIGEVDILLNDPRSQNTIKREIVPGYGVQIEKRSTGGYKIMFNYKEYSKSNLNGIAKTEEFLFPEGTDITNTYYDYLKKARGMYDENQKVSEMMQTQMQNDPNMKPVTYQELMELSKNIGSGY